MSLMSNDKPEFRPHDNRITTWIVVLLILIAELFVFTWSRVQCRAVAYNLTQQQDEHNNQLSLKRKLIIERAHLRSPERIAAIAEERMNLHIPEQNQILTLR